MGFHVSFRECSFCGNARAFTFKWGTKKWKSFAAPQKRYAGWDVSSFEKSPDFQGVFCRFVPLGSLGGLLSKLLPMDLGEILAKPAGRETHTTWVVYGFAVFFFFVFFKLKFDGFVGWIHEKVPVFFTCVPLILSGFDWMLDVMGNVHSLVHGCCHLLPNKSCFFREKSLKKNPWGVGLVPEKVCPQKSTF